jgi:hypothetical protein
METLKNNKYVVAAALIAVLVIANFFVHIWSNWGLITVKVTDAPIGQVIKSIEWQGWVTIYSNIDPQTKISMYVDHVTLPEAMETLAVNAEAQWHLGFFAAPTASGVKEEIRSFQEGADRTDDSNVYSFPTPMDMFADEDTPVVDPRRQAWPGLPATPPPASPTADGSAPDPEPAPSSVQGYLRAFAEHADVWIMAPSSWDPPVSAAPPASSSISSAVRSLVDRAHGSVSYALILRGREQRVAGQDRPRGGGGGGFNLDLSSMEDRVQNEINTLPPAPRAAALAQLNQEIQFQKEVASAPPDQRRQMWRKHMIDRRMNNDNSWRRSPEQRAQRFARVVSNRMVAQGKQ